MTKPEEGENKGQEIVKTTVKQGRRKVEVTVYPSTHVGDEIISRGIPKARVIKDQQHLTPAQLINVLESNERAARKSRFRKTE